MARKRYTPEQIIRRYLREADVLNVSVMWLRHSFKNHAWREPGLLFQLTEQ